MILECACSIQATIKTPTRPTYTGYGKALGTDAGHGLKQTHVWGHDTAPPSSSGTQNSVSATLITFSLWWWTVYETGALNRAWVSLLEGDQKTRVGSASIIYF